MSANDYPCYSMRLVQPFIQYLSQFEMFSGQALKDLWPPDPDERMSVSEAHKLVETAVEVMGDQMLGLKVGRTVSFGAMGVMDYLMSSARNIRESFLDAGRYTPLLNDVLDIRIENEEERAVVQMLSRVALPDVAEDFLLSSFYSNRLSRYSPEIPEFECWFQHARPKEIGEYKSTFPGATLRFMVPCGGFVFGKDFLETPLQSADPNLHFVVSKYADKLMSELPRRRNTTEQVIALFSRELSGGRVTSSYVARKLRMSARTLSRKLAEEGTTFTILLNDLRQRLALQYLEGPDFSLAEIAFLLGFSDSAVFHRAFKRWTGQTPLEYRRQSR